jgi:hypothetical protein
MKNGSHCGAEINGAERFPHRDGATLSSIWNIDTSAAGFRVSMGILK